MEKPISDFQAQVMLDSIISGTRYMALSVSKPTLAGVFTEVSGTSYARVNLATKFTTPNVGERVIANTDDIAFPAAGGTWTEARYWCIMDASTSGNLIVFGELFPSATLVNTQTLTLATGQVVLHLP